MILTPAVRATAGLGLTQIIGWGTTKEHGGTASNKLLKATVPYVPDSTCKRHYGDRLLPKDDICAGYPHGGVDTCSGDSGGPMIRKDDAGQWIEVGTVSPFSTRMRIRAHSFTRKRGPGS